jgi:DNA topoisomerase-1
LSFAGCRAVYEAAEEEKTTEDGPEDVQEEMPPLTQGEILSITEVKPAQHFTQPPPFYTDASLIKTLEEKGIGRPSTYAPIISTITERGYVERQTGRLVPTELGIIVNGLLLKSFSDLFEVEFTAGMEEGLDSIEEGKEDKTKLLTRLYQPLIKDTERAKEEMRDIKGEMETATSEVCDKCGKPMIIKWGRHGKFMACSGYPECKNTKPVRDLGNGRFEVSPQEETTEVCEKCGGKMVIKFGRFGKFLACGNYPECRSTKSIPIGAKCPKCGGDIVARRSRKKRVFYGCSKYPNCDFVSWQKPVQKACPQCHALFLVEKYTKGSGAMLACVTQDCGYQEKNQTDNNAAETAPTVPPSGPDPA